MRQGVRDAYHDTPQARSVITRKNDTVVDTGLRLESTPQWQILGISAEQADGWANDVEARFDSWCRSRKVMRDETMDFYQAQRLAGLFQQRDNDYFVRFYYSPRRDLLNPLQLQFVDPNQIRGSEYVSTDFNYRQVDGIIRDAAGKETAYRVWVQDDKADTVAFKEILVPAMGARSGRRLMIHGYSAEYAGQGRGLPGLASAIQEFENLTDFTAAQIKKAIAQSSITMYVKPALDAPSSAPFEGITTRYGAGPADVAYTPGNVPTVDETETCVSYHPLPEATTMVPGSVGVFNLEGGEDIKPFSNTAPSDTYETFVDAFTSHLSAMNGLPIEVLKMKFGQNYSASRATLLLFWRVAQIDRDNLAADFLNIVYEAWLGEEIAAGRIAAPGWQDPRMRQAWVANTWIGAPMPNIDPMRTAKADKEYVEMGAQTLDRVARNLNGSSGQMNRQKLAREYEELPEAPWSKAAAPAAAPEEEDKNG
jgi:lambda family phage portal protein